MGITYAIEVIKDKTTCLTNTSNPFVIYHRNICNKVLNWCKSGCPTPEISALASEVQVGAAGGVRLQVIDYPAT